MDSRSEDSRTMTKPNRLVINFTQIFNRGIPELKITGVEQIVALAF
jgi:hypothetical protein